MNEVTRIHLGRQPFTIAVDAHGALKAYLHEIRGAVRENGDDVQKEIELRMAELLKERGITSDKVVLLEDVDFLKHQLGDPKDFSEEASESTAETLETTKTKRLFRDTSHGMLAGVAAGLANYFGLDVTLVRIIFVVTVFAGGWGILLYIALWLLIPEAKSSSERLQMYGKAVTIDSLKSVVERADVPGAAQRAENAIAPVINAIFRVVMKILGFALILGALSVLFALIAIGVYMASHHGSLFQEGFFPVGVTEHVLAIVGLVWFGLVSLFMIIIGMAMVRRKWPIAPWATGVILGLLFVGLASGIALTADTGPTIRDRFTAAHHTMNRSLQPFSAVDIKGDLPVRIVQSSNYDVTLRYIGNPNLGSIKTQVTNGRLELDSSQFMNRTDCTMLCLFKNYDMQITIYTPDTLKITPPYFSDNLYNISPEVPVAPAMPVQPKP